MRPPAARLDGEARPARRCTLYPLDPGATYLDLAFGDVVVERTARPPGFGIRKVEAEVARLAGLKSLYSDSCHDEAGFWALHDRDAHARLKRLADPGHALGDLYAKCVRHGTALPRR